MNSTDQNDKTRIITEGLNANSEENQLNNESNEAQPKKNFPPKQEKNTGISKGAFAAGVAAAGIGGVAAGTVFSEEIKGTVTGDNHSSATSDEAVGKGAEHVEAVEAVESTASSSVDVSQLVDQHEVLQDTSNEHANEIHMDISNAEGHYEVVLSDLNADGIADSMSANAEMVDGSHITFSASGTALTELMQNEGFELADSTDYIQEANSGYFESFDASSFGAADYEIQSGDTLSEIAEANGTSVAHIMELNPDIADPNVIFAGDNILLPQNDVVSGPYDGWRPEWSESSSDFESLETETYNVTGESDYSDSYEAAYSEEGYDSTDEQTDSTNYDSVDWESFEDQPVDDYSSYLGQEDFASYDSPESYYDSGEMNGFDFI